MSMAAGALIYLLPADESPPRQTAGPKDTRINASLSTVDHAGVSGDRRDKTPGPEPYDRSDEGETATGIRTGGLSSSTPNTVPDQLSFKVPDGIAESSSATATGSPGNGAGVAPTPGEYRQDTEPEHPALSLSGWVMDQDGEVIPGINLVAQAIADSTATGPAVSTRTDAEGHFEFSSLRDGAFEVVSKPTDRFKSARAVLRAGADAAVLVVAQQESQKIGLFGKVTAAGGGALAGVRVVANGQSRNAVTTDENGDYDLTLDIGRSGYTYSVRYMLSGYRHTQIRLTERDIGDKSDLRRDMVLKQSGDLAEVTGTVTGIGGAPVQNASIQLFSARTGLRYQTTSDKAGDFKFTGVESMDGYRLWVRPKSLYRNHVEYGIAVEAVATDLPIVLQPLRKTSFKGQIVDPAGDPIPRLKLWARIPHASSARYLGFTTDHGGRFRLDRVPEGEITFTSRSQPNQSIYGVMVVPGGKEVRLTMEFGDLEVAGFVVDGRGDGIAGARVSLTWFHDEDGIRSHSKRQTVTDREGYFLFTRVGAGTHRLAVSASGFRPVQFDRRVWGARGEITVRLDEQTSRRASRN